MLFTDLAHLMHATEASPLRLGNVEFWIDSAGPWAGVLSFSVPSNAWNAAAMGADVASLARVHPEVYRIVAKYAGCVDAQALRDQFIHAETERWLEDAEWNGGSHAAR